MCVILFIYYTLLFTCYCCCRSGSSWLRVTPFAIRKQLKWIKDRFNNIPMYITENGVTDRNGSLIDTYRISYYRAYINEVLKGTLNLQFNINNIKDTMLAILHWTSITLCMYEIKLLYQYIHVWLHFQMNNILLDFLYYDYVGSHKIGWLQRVGIHGMVSSWQLWMEQWLLRKVWTVPCRFQWSRQKTHCKGVCEILQANYSRERLQSRILWNRWAWHCTWARGWDLLRHVSGWVCLEFGYCGLSGGGSMERRR